MREPAWISQPAPIARAALEVHIRMDHRVGADLTSGLDVGRRRVDERHAGGHQFFVLLLSHDFAHFRQLRRGC